MRTVILRLLARLLAWLPNPTGEDAGMDAFQAVNTGTAVRP